MNSLWKGRFDSTEKEHLRLWQIIETFTNESIENSIIFIGYDTQEGIIRNKGRAGAKEGADAIRSAMSSFPNLKNIKIYEMGNLENKKLEYAQKEFSEKIEKVLLKKSFPIGLGGGHDIVYGNYLGIRKVFPNKKLGIINFDTHLDMRDYEKGGNSGTSFKQILDNDENVNYLIIGYKDIGNTEYLRKLADKYKVEKLFNKFNVEEMRQQLQIFINKVDIIYITFCMDVFDASIAPGVSAPTVIGLEAQKALFLLQNILKSNKVISADFAEVNPSLDIDNRTAKLAGTLAYEILQYFHINKI